MEEMRNAKEILVGKHQETRIRGRQRDDKEIIP
jgi:hypothetical protein